MSYNMNQFNYEQWDYIDTIIKRYRPLIKKNKKEAIKFIYKEQTGRILDFNNISTFNEKLNLNKIDRKKIKLYSKYADKNLVRKYVKKKIGSQYLIPQYFCKKKIRKKDLEKLPNKFAVKTNNGSGTNYIVYNKEKENLQLICNYLNRLVKIKYGYIWGELLYNNISPRIVAEELITDKNGNIPDDLKCFCFIDNEGIKRKILYFERVVGDERHRIMLDEKWNEINIGSSFSRLNIKIKKPNNSDEILEVLDKLSSDFNFVRVDLYVMNDKIYFGELTFIPTAGFLGFENAETDITWGSYIGNNLK